MSIEPQAAALPGGLSANAFSSLFQSVNGLRNRRAIIALLGCLFAGLVVTGLLFTVAGGMFASFVAFIVYIVAVGTGVNSAGILQMDEARGRPARSLADALVAGLMCIPKLIVLALAFIAVEIGVFIVVALLLLLCKIPVLGALLFVVVFPLSVVAIGLTIFGLFLCLVLSLPAIWQGESIMLALSQTLAIARTRLIEAILLLVFVAFLYLAIGFIVIGVLGAGLLPTVGMSASIVGFTGIGDMGSMMGMAQNIGDGRAVAGIVGVLVLWAIAGSLVGQVYLRGLSLVYLRVTEGLDVGAAEAALRAKLDEARRRASELTDRGHGTAPADGASSGSAAAMASGAAAAGSAAAFGAVPPAYDPPAVYNPPPAYSPPQASFEAMQSAAFGATTPIAPPAASRDDEPDIALPFDDAAAPLAMGGSAVPPARPPIAADVALPLAPAPALPATTTCPQCLSAVTPDDAFCSVCGYRLK